MFPSPPWIRFQPKGVSKPAWHNPKDRTSVIWSSKERKWVMQVESTIKSSTGTHQLEEVVGYYASELDAWKDYMWRLGYKVSK